MPVLLGQGSVWRRAQTVIWGDRGRILLQIHSNTQTQQIHVRHNHSLRLSFPAICSTNQRTYCTFLQMFLFIIQNNPRHLSQLVGVKVWVGVWWTDISLHHTTATHNSSQQQTTQHVKSFSFSGLLAWTLQTSKNWMLSDEFNFPDLSGTLVCYDMIQRGVQKNFYFFLFFMNVFSFIIISDVQTIKEHLTGHVESW